MAEESRSGVPSGLADPPWRGMRVAIAHDWFQGYHGSERVVDTMLNDVFSAAAQVDVYGFHAAREVLPTPLAGAIVREYAPTRLPGVRQRGHDPGLWRYLMPRMAGYWRSIDFADYDILIASSHAFALHSRPARGAVHSCYCYTPIRYAWLHGPERDRLQGLRGAALRAWSRRLQNADREAAANVADFVAISSAVRDRIRAFYGREASIIHPPVEVDDLSPGDSRDNQRFLWVHRFVSYKRPEVVLEAFRDTPYRLTMVGVGPLAAALRRRAPANVEILDWVEREQLAAMYGSTCGFIHLGEEDFGITMVEALAAGTPVIALNRGGATDIVRDGIDGLLLDSASPDSLRSALDKVVDTEWDRPALVERAARFSRQAFVEAYGRHIADLCAKQAA